MSESIENDEYEDYFLIQFKDALHCYNLFFFIEKRELIRHYFKKGYETENGSTVFDFLISIKTENELKSLQAILSLYILEPNMPAGGLCYYDRGLTLLEQFSYRKDEIGVRAYIHAKFFAGLKMHGLIYLSI
jgi:hypothetical protein